MTQITIENKKYVLIPEKNYVTLQKRAALKIKTEKLFSIEDARALSKKYKNPLYIVLLKLLGLLNLKV